MSEFKFPMLCKTSLRESLDTGNWEGYVAEPKHDGMRCIAVVNEDGVKLYGRSGLEYTEHVPHLVQQLKDLPYGTILDGELAIVSHKIEIYAKLVPVTAFNPTMRVMGSLAPRARELQLHFGPIQFIVYDVLEFEGKDLTTDPYHMRRGTLRFLYDGVLAAEDVILNPVFDVVSEYGDLFDVLVEHSVEGIICKNVHSRYEFGGRPNKTWYKVKAATTMDMVITGYKSGNGKFAGLIGAIEFSRWDEVNEKLVYVGRCSGMSDEVRRDISEHQEEYLGRVIEVKANDLVGSKRKYLSCRHPQFVGFRDDKRPEECLGEELINPEWKDD